MINFDDKIKLLEQEISLLESELESIKQAIKQEKQSYQSRLEVLEAEVESDIKKISVKLEPLTFKKNINYDIDDSVISQIIYSLYNIDK